VRAAIDTTQDQVDSVQDDRFKSNNDMRKTIEIFRSPLIELNKDILKGVEIIDEEEEDQ
jgi:hypothetical protein